MVRRVEQSAARSQARRSAAAYYALVVLFGIAAAELSTGPSSLFGAIVLIPYVTVVLSASVLGRLLSGWYFSETGVFEAITVPFIVVICSALIAGQFFSQLLPLFQTVESGTFLVRVVSGFYSSMIFLAASWPAVTPTAAVASYRLWKKYRKLD